MRLLAFPLLLQGCVLLEPTDPYAGMGSGPRSSFQPPQAVRVEGPLFLEQALEVALVANPGLAQAGHELEAAVARKDAAFGEALPSLEAVGGYTRHLDDQRLLPPRSRGDSIVFSRNLVSAELLLSLPLFTGGRISSRIAAAELLERAAEHRLARTREELVFDVTHVFFSILAQRRTIETLESSKATLQEHLRRVQDLIEAGKAARVDRLRTEVRIADLESKLAAENNLLAIQHRILASLLGQQGTVEPAGELGRGALEPLELQAALTRAFSTRADYLAARAALEAQAKAVDAARAEARAAGATLQVAQARLADLRAGTRPEEIAKAEEALRQAEEHALFARGDLARVDRLAKSGSLPAEAFERAQVESVGAETRLAAARRHLEMLQAGSTPTAIAVHEALVEEARARLDLAQTRLAECIIFAPFSGTISAVHVRPGDLATPRAPLLELTDPGSIVVRVALPEAHAAAVRPGMPARVAFDARPGRSFPARVERAFPELDRRTRMRTVELGLDQPAAFVPGMFARVELILETVEEALTLPYQALLVRPGGGRAVFVVVEGRAFERPVTTGIERAGRIQVLEGLEPHDRVVIAGNERLREGMEVRLAAPPGPKGKRGPTTDEGP